MFKNLPNFEIFEVVCHAVLIIPLDSASLLKKLSSFLCPSPFREREALLRRVRSGRLWRGCARFASHSTIVVNCSTLLLVHHFTNFGLEVLYPFIEVGVALDDHLQLAGLVDADAPWMLGA